MERFIIKLQSVIKFKKMKKIIIAISLLFSINYTNAQIFIPQQFIPIIFQPSASWINSASLQQQLQLLQQQLNPPILTAIGPTDTLVWLQTHIQAKSDSFAGKPLSRLLDSLYMLKMVIKEFTPPAAIKSTSTQVGTNLRDYNRDTLFVDSLTFYFAPISDGGYVFQAHMNNDLNNLTLHTNNTINTHVKYFRVVFLDPVPYLKSIARSKNGRGDWSPFAEYFWGPKIIQSVKVGEY
jgi:hypothetical protein